jgi:hypothetical protein
MALLAFDIAEGAVTARHRNRKIERGPAFAGLRLAGEDG